MINIEPKLAESYVEILDNMKQWMNQTHKDIEQLMFTSSRSHTASQKRFIHDFNTYIIVLKSLQKTLKGLPYA
jgi:hypothetical protein